MKKEEEEEEIKQALRRMPITTVYKIFQASINGELTNILCDIHNEVAIICYKWEETLKR